MFKKLNKKGFTLAELLVVVAIIGVLVAISIPIFTSQLEKSRDAVTLSNIRAAYAQAQTAYLTGSGDGTGANGNTDATVTVEVDDTSKKVKSVTVKGVEAKGQTPGLDGLTNLPFANVVGNSLDTMGGTTGKYDIKFTYTSDKISGVIATAEK